MTSDVIDAPDRMVVDIDEEILVDRRRPGRTDVSPTLLPLLRVPDQGAGIPPLVRSDLAEDDWEQSDIDPVGPAKGLALGLVLSVPLWGVIGAVAYLAFR